MTLKKESIIIDFKNFICRERNGSIMDIRFVKRDVLKEKPDQKHLGFGKYMTDYMFVMDWTKEDGWKDARIVPEGPISLEPACVTLHYAQETFEGMKAYRTLHIAADHLLSILFFAFACPSVPNSFYLISQIGRAHV